MMESKPEHAFNSVVFVLILLAMFSTITPDVLGAVKLALEIAFHYNYTMKREIPTITDDMYNRVLFYFQPLAELAEQRGYPAKRMDKNRMTKEEIRHMLSVIIEPLLYTRTDDELFDLEMTVQDGDEFLTWPIKNLEVLSVLWTQQQKNRDLFNHLTVHYNPEGRIKSVELEGGREHKRKADRAETWPQAKMNDKTVNAIVLHCSGYSAMTTEVRIMTIANRVGGIVSEGGWMPNKNTEKANEEVRKWDDGPDEVEWDMMPVSANEEKQATGQEEVSERSNQEDAVEWEIMLLMAEEQANKCILGQSQDTDVHRQSKTVSGPLSIGGVAETSVQAIPSKAVPGRTRAQMEMPVEVSDLFSVVPRGPAQIGESTNDQMDLRDEEGPGSSADEETSDLTNHSEDHVAWGTVNIAEGARGNILPAAQPEKAVDYDLIELEIPSTPLKHDRQDSNREHWGGYSTGSPSQLDDQRGQDDTLELGSESSASEGGIGEIPNTPVNCHGIFDHEFCAGRHMDSSGALNNQTSIAGVPMSPFPMLSDKVDNTTIPMTPVNRGRHGLCCGLWAVAGSSSTGPDRANSQAGPSGFPRPTTMTGTQSSGHDLWPGSPLNNLNNTTNQDEPSRDSGPPVSTSECGFTVAPMRPSVDISGTGDMQAPSTPLGHNQRDFDRANWARSSPTNLDETNHQDPSTLVSFVTDSNPTQDDVWAGLSAGSIDEVTNLLGLSRLAMKIGGVHSNLEAGPSRRPACTDTGSTPVPQAPPKYSQGEYNSGHLDNRNSQPIAKNSDTYPLRIDTRKPGVWNLRAAASGSEAGSEPTLVLANEPLEQRVADNSGDLINEIHSLSLDTHKDLEISIGLENSPTISDSSFPSTPLVQELSRPISKQTEEYCNEMAAYWELEVRDKWQVEIAQWNEEDCLPEPKPKPKQGGAEERAKAALELSEPKRSRDLMNAFIFPPLLASRADHRETNSETKPESTQDTPTDSTLCGLHEVKVGPDAAVDHRFKDTMDKSSTSLEIVSSAKQHGSNSSPAFSEWSLPLASQTQEFPCLALKTTEDYLNEMNTYWEAGVRDKWNAGIAQWNENDCLPEPRLKPNSKPGLVKRQGGAVQQGGAVARAKAALGLLDK